MPAPAPTESLIRGYIDEGRGSGHGDTYKPWIQIKRWNSSPVSTQSMGPFPGLLRSTHFLCRSELLLALFLAWIGALVREQLPLWPWRHPHPLFGYSERFEDGPWAPGTLDLCKEAGIQHGYFIGSSIPYVWTMDLVATLAWLPPEEVTCAMLSVKPLDSEKYSGDIDPVARGPEKLEIERRYAEYLSISYFVADRSMFPGPLLGQLDDLRSSSSIDGESDVAVRRLLEARGADLSLEAPDEWIQRLKQDYGLTNDRARTAARFMIWHQLVDVDLSRPLQYDRVPHPGGRRLITNAREMLLKGNM